MLQLWFRPWAGLDGTGRRYCELTARDKSSSVRLEPAAAWIYTAPEPAGIGERAGPWPAGPTLGTRAIPLPLRPGDGVKVRVGALELALDTSALPRRPDEHAVPQDDRERRALALLGLVKSVWARLRDVEGTLADPSRMWDRLRALWLDGHTQADPEMDIIVRHARRLPPVLDHIDRTLRRILRRTHKMVPLPRVQELDRRAMSALSRRPGDTIAERAGHRQRILAVVREESFNTLENRVVVSYARMAQEVARDYCDRHKSATRSPRVAMVQKFGKRCWVLERDLYALGVFGVGADVTANFVLQNNVAYRAVWDAWQELQHRRRVLDELWRWQARSWEEFCALVVVIALQSRANARLVAVSPIVFNEEQEAGCWIHHVNPLAVLFRPDIGVTVEVHYRPDYGGRSLAKFGAPIWLRLGRIDSDNFLSRWPVWPVWHAEGGLEPGEADEIAALLPHSRAESVAGGITLRPIAQGADAEECRGAQTACFTLGAAGPALRAGIERLAQYLEDCVLRQTL